MKSSIRKLALALVILIASTAALSAQVYVKIRPVIPIQQRPPQPSRSHVWIREEWQPNGDRYQFSGEHWETPPHPGNRWRNGHWRRHGGRGHEWVRGNWR